MLENTCRLNNAGRSATRPRARTSDALLQTRRTMREPAAEFAGVGAGADGPENDAKRRAFRDHHIVIDGARGRDHHVRRAVVLAR